MVVYHKINITRTVFVTYKEDFMKKLCLLLTLCLLATCLFIGCKDDKSGETSDNSSQSSVEEKSSADSLQESESFSEEESSSDNLSEDNSSSAETDQEADPYQRDLQIYTDYLKNGGYTQLYLEGYKDDDIKDFAIKTKLFDLELNDENPDAVYELFISIRGLGAENVSALLTIEKGTPKVMFRTEHWGGSMGGESLEINWDTQLQKYAMVTTSAFRDGKSAHMATVKYYTAEDNYSTPVTTTYTSGFTSDSGYDEEIERVKSETSLYVEEDDYLAFYKVNGEYVTEADFEKAALRFAEDGEHNIVLTDGSYDTPIK